MVTERYQRDYAWEAEEVSEFLGDVAVIVSRRSGGEPDFAHFFGALVAVDIARVAYSRHANEVIDGQQRLTTFTLLLGAFRDAARQLLPGLSEGAAERAKTFINTIGAEYLLTQEPNQQTWADEPRRLFASTDRDNDVLAAIIDFPSGFALAGDARDSHRLLWEAYGRISKYVIEHYSVGDPDQALGQLTNAYTAIAGGSEMIFISTTSHQHAHQLFSVLNDRGRGLEQSDLLRSHVLMLASNLDIHAQKKVAYSWDAIDRFSPITVDGFFRHYYASRFGERLPSTQIFKKYVERYFAGLAEAVPPNREAWLVSATEALAAAMTLYEPLSRGAWPFAEPENASSTPRWDRDRVFRIVRTLGSERALPLLLSAANLGRKNLQKLAVALERIEFRALLADVEQNQVAAMYFDVAALLAAGYLNTDQAIAELESWVSRWADDRTFSSAVGQLEYGTSRQTSQIKHLLTTIEDHSAWLGDGKPWPPTCSKSSSWDMTQVEDEHIYPQNPAGGLPSRLTPHIHRLGNQAFWGPGDNKAKEASNLLPTNPLKIAAYKKATSKMLNRIGSSIELTGKWGVTEIRRREAELREAAARVWAMSPAARSRGATLGSTRPRLFSWRSDLDIRTWAVPSHNPIGGHTSGVDYRLPTTMNLSRSIMKGDTLVIYDANDIVTEKSGAGPAVVALARVANVAFDVDGVRIATYESGTGTDIAHPRRPLPLVTSAVGPMPRRPTKILELTSVTLEA